MTLSSGTKPNIVIELTVWLEAGAVPVNSMTDSPWISIPAESSGFSPGLLPSTPGWLSQSLSSK